MILAKSDIEKKSSAYKSEAASQSEFLTKEKKSKIDMNWDFEKSFLDESQSKLSNYKSDKTLNVSKWFRSKSELTRPKKRVDFPASIEDFKFGKW